MNAIPLAVGLGLAVGVGLIAHSLLSLVFEVGKRFLRPLARGRLQALGLGGIDAAVARRNKVRLLGKGDLPWGNLYAGAAILGLLLLIFLGPQLPAARVGILALPGLVWLAQRYLIYQSRRFILGQVRQFLIDVRLHMSLAGSLLLGLENLGRVSLETSPIYLSLREHLKGASAHSGLDLLARLAEDVSSPHLSQAVTRLQAASASGGLSDLDAALGARIEELNEEIAYRSEEQMQRLPLRITLLAMPFLLAPIVILLFYPLVDRILKTLSGVSVGGGF